MSEVTHILVEWTTQAGASGCATYDTEELRGEARCKLQAERRIAIARAAGGTNIKTRTYFANGSHADKAYPD
jgi:hypothetical protein